eukprot:1212087-Pyramimonas_sp.AAC.2
MTRPPSMTEAKLACGVAGLCELNHDSLRSAPCETEAIRLGPLTSAESSRTTIRVARRATTRLPNRCSLCGGDQISFVWLRLYTPSCASPTLSAEVRRAWGSINSAIAYFTSASFRVKQPRSPPTSFLL